jgi:hypothetical protein
LDYIYIFGPVALEIVCIVHAVKSGRVFPWLYVIIFLPVLGSVVYLGVEVVPEMVRGRASRQLATGLRTVTDPNRGFRQARRAVEMVGSVDAKRALAEEHLARRQYTDAVALYEGALTGQFSEDPALLQGLARARLLAGDGAGAQAALDALQKADPSFVSADERLLYARALEMQGKQVEALAAYKKVAPLFPGEEACCRYAMLLQKTGMQDEARTLFAEIVKSLDGAPGHYRRAQKEWGAIARAGLK